MLLERERELGELRSALEEVIEGRGCVVGIEAAAGLGKTGLLQEARASGAEAGLNVLAGRATELEQDFPFALVRQLLGAEIARLPAEEREQVFEGAGAARAALGVEADEDRDPDAFAVLHALYWVTAALAERRPVLLAIDDAHSADAASLDYLGFLLPRLEELPVLVVITGRPDEPDPSGGFRRIMTDTSVRHMTLVPLGAEASAAVLAEELGAEPAPGFAAACFKVTGGNPFLLRELSRTLNQQGIEPLGENAGRVRELVPERVAQTVVSRIERLPASAGAVARSLAILGDGPDPRLVARLAEVDPAEAASAADSLRAIAILDPGASLRFIHPLVRSAVYESVPGGERTGAHLRAAEILREAEASPEQVATQLLAAEPQGDRRTVEALIVAGERAIARGAPHSSVAYLTRAMREPPPAKLRAAVLEPLLSAIVRDADNTVLAAIEEEVVATIDDQPSLLSRWGLLLTGAMALNGRFGDGADLLREAFEQANREGETERAFVLGEQHNTMAAVVDRDLLDLSHYYGRLDPDSQAGRLAAAAEARAAAVEGSPREAAEAARRALGDDIALYDEGSDLVAVVAVVMILIAADETAAARRAMDLAVAANLEQGATSGLVRALMLSSLAAWSEGDLVGAEPDIRQAMDLARDAKSATLLLLLAGVLIEVLIERDELGEAQRELDAIGMGDGPMPDSPMFTVLRYVRGHLRAERGDFDLAREDFAALSYAKEGWDFSSLNVSYSGPLAARTLVAEGEAQSARELAESMEPLARRWDSPSTTAHMLRTRAAAGEGEQAIADLEEAVGLLEDSPRRLEYVHALLDLGEALRRAGRRADARAPLRSALQVARQCGAARVAKRAADELQATGEKVRSYAPIGVESLTPSERRVAELAATGMTNRQIAQSLFVTLKTVEAHLSATYDKLDISSRRELPGALGDGPIQPAD
ncbi:MAG TPA: AAA family ATPase [Solirubrobacterales bacterium]|nr:AAA family ATPase [Solirubrobacterales bacterium]